METASYNTVLTLLVAGVLGGGGGFLGVFVCLSQRALVSDAVCHSTMAGIAAAFLLTFAMGSQASGWQLALGAVLAAFAAASIAFWLPKDGKLEGDGATACVLALFFSLAAVLLSAIQNLPYAGQAGLGRFFIGNAAAVTIDDAVLVGVATAVTVLGCIIFFRQLTALCFDREFFALTPMGAKGAESALAALVSGFVLAGIQTVGIIFTVALLVAPFATMRLWFNRLKPLAAASAVAGVAAGVMGSLISLGDEARPTGALVVLSGGAVFALSATAYFCRRLLTGKT